MGLGANDLFMLIGMKESHFLLLRKSGLETFCG